MIVGVPAQAIGALGLHEEKLASNFAPSANAAITAALVAKEFHAPAWKITPEESALILFLDFDGVLHPEAVKDLSSGAVRAASDFSHLHHFEKLMREYTQIEIVISSAWREANSLETLQGYFSPDIAARIIGVTPVLPPDLDARREKEIRAWLIEAGREDEPFIAIDDWPLLFSENCEFLFWVDPQTAFDEATAEALRQRLQRMICH